MKTASQIVHYQQTPSFWIMKAEENKRQGNVLKTFLEKRNLPIEGSGMDYWIAREKYCQAEADRLCKGNVVDLMA